MQTLSILLIDTNESEFHQARSILSGSHTRNMVLEWAPTGEDGRNKVAQGHYDAVLVAYDLGEATGAQLIRELISQGYSLPLVLFTQPNSPEIDVEVMQSGATIFLSKDEITSPILEQYIQYAIDRRQVEEKLAYQAGVLEAVHDAIIATDAEMNVTFWNRAAEHLYGWTREEALGKYVPDLVKSELKGLERENVISNSMKTGIFHGEVIHHARDGKQLIIEASTFFQKDRSGKITGVISANRDVTERKRTEEMLQETHRQAVWMARFPDENPSPVARVSFDGTVLYCNEAVSNLPGWMGEVGKPLPDPLVSLVKQAMDQESEVRQDVQLAERHYSISVMPFPHENYANLYGMDITARKQAETGLQEYAKQLQKSNHALQDFAFIASHDLQEPLRKIQAFGDMLKSRYEHELGVQGYDYIDRMRNAAQRMSDMLTGLLEYSRVTTHSRPYEKVDLNEIAREVLSDLEARIMQTGGSVKLEPLPTIQADPLQMRQLLQNLIGNALKFHRAGVAPLVTVKGSMASIDKIDLTIEDNGIGFEKKDAEKLFMPFQRLNMRSEYEGSGMGLAICHKIVERHGGTISATSEPGKGSVFTVSLPV